MVVSACNQYVASMQSVCSEHAISTCKRPVGTRRWLLPPQCFRFAYLWGGGRGEHVPVGGRRGEHVPVGGRRGEHVHAWSGTRKANRGNQRQSEASHQRQSEAIRGHHRERDGLISIASGTNRHSIVISGTQP